MKRRTRQFPNPRDLAPLLRFKRFELNPTERRLQNSHTIEDVRTIAKRRTPRGPFDFTDGGADSETTLKRARQAFEDIE